MSDIKEKLVKVREIVASDRWTQETIGSPDGPVCLIGAVSEVDGGFRSTNGVIYRYPGNDNSLVKALFPALPASARKRARGDAETALYEYNDTRSRGRVLSLIDRAIANCKETS